MPGWGRNFLPLSGFSCTETFSIMQTITLSAHFDGQQIQLDEPFMLEPGSQLMVTILPGREAERVAWQQLSGQGLARSYGDEEPDYSLADVKQPNPEYAGS